jgi:hypothetical protein
MAIHNAARPADTSAQITVAGMAADLYGFADERPPLVLLPGLTFDRGSGSRYSTTFPASTQAGRCWPLTFPVMASHQTSSRTRYSTSSA